MQSQPLHERSVDLHERTVAVVVDGADFVDFGADGTDELGVEEEAVEGPRESLSGGVTAGDDEVKDRVAATR